MSIQDEYIIENDIVNVYFENINAIYNAKVLYKPQSDNDCWHLLDEKETLIYVQRFYRMDRVRKG